MHSTTGATARALAIVGLSCLLAACPRGTRPPAEATPGVPPLPTPDVQAPELDEAAVYELNSAESVVAILVYRGGTLARLGHNHVMSARSLQGRVWIHPELERSGFELTFPVAELVVDDPAARSDAGSEFSSEIRQADREGTRKNMLRAEVLDAELYPVVQLRSVRASGTLQSLLATTRITIKNVSRDIDVPVAVTLTPERRTANGLVAQGEFDIEQSAFGIKPFSIGLGALEVQDRLHIKFRIVAQRAHR